MKAAALAILILVGLALIPSMPYGYYPVMRWIVCVSSVFAAVQAHHHGKALPWLLALVAGIYNPIAPVHSTRAIWSIVNVATIVLALAVLALPAKPAVSDQAPG